MLREQASSCVSSLPIPAPASAAAELERVFEPFFTTKPRGSGLGLAICERIIAAHGGDIHAENARGGGAVVTVTLPVVRS